ncbi:uncharacterized protein LOC123290564 [Chrysoperla carnea]|uniref:uncharacterized protein LOC123290564 n=1 Tax=Chrysoperla carnea TaxID=189513 RepID=UPI001D08B689|nr:uncharacterized protein LOC123290564 [Chrysoperla carnea]
MVSDIKDYYKLLNIKMTATESEIKSAYRKQALYCHPDKNKSPNAAALFRELTEAKNKLTNPNAREIYDRQLLQKRQELLKQERLRQELLKQERLRQERLEQERLQQKLIQEEQDRLRQKRLEQERLQQKLIQEEQDRLRKEELEQKKLRNRVAKIKIAVICKLRKLKRNSKEVIINRYNILYQQLVSAAQCILNTYNFVISLPRYCYIKAICKFRQFKRNSKKMIINTYNFLYQQLVSAAQCILNTYNFVISLPRYCYVKAICKFRQFKRNSKKMIINTYNFLYQQLVSAAQCILNTYNFVISLPRYCYIKAICKFRQFKRNSKEMIINTYNFLYQQLVSAAQCILNTYNFVISLPRYCYIKAICKFRQFKRNSKEMIINTYNFLYQQLVSAAQCFLNTYYFVISLPRYCYIKAICKFRQFKRNSKELIINTYNFLYQQLVSAAQCILNTYNFVISLPRYCYIKAICKFRQFKRNSKEMIINTYNFLYQQLVSAAQCILNTYNFVISLPRYCYIKAICKFRQFKRNSKEMIINTYNFLYKKIVAPIRYCLLNTSRNFLSLF